MSCNNIKTCFRIGTDYKDRLITPTDGLGGLSDFRYEIKNQLGGLVKNLTVGAGLEIVGDKIVIQGDALEDLPVGKYDAVFWLKINTHTHDLFSEQLEISADKCDCQNLYNLAFTIIPVDIEENVVNIYLSWEDLTPEQILELQQPAIDAGNEVRQQVYDYIEAKELQINTDVQAAENIRIDNENERIGAENDRQAWEDERDENEDERILNESERVSAENTRKSAENTRISNESIRQSQESTRQSNETTRQNQEGTRQTNETARVNAESSRVTAENSRVSAESARVLAESARVANDANRLAVVASYTHSGNKEIVVSSFSGNTMTSVGHGLSNGNNLAIVFALGTVGEAGISTLATTVPVLGIMPVAFATVGFFVVNATADTFQLSLTAGGAALAINPAADFTRYRFERIVNPAVNITFNPLPAMTDFKIILQGGIIKTPLYVNLNTGEMTQYSNITAGTTVLSIGLQRDIRSSISGKIEIDISATKGGVIINRNNRLVSHDATGKLINAFENYSQIHYSNKTPVTGIVLPHTALSNGSIIKIIRS